MNLRVVIESIRHRDQRYPTVGDWFWDKGTLHIRVSEEVGGWREQALIALHEAVECLICKHKGIAQEVVDVFDKKFEEERELGLHEMHEEPGDDAKAPYYKQHQIATGFERILAAELGVDWNTYANKIESL